LEHVTVIEYRKACGCRSATATCGRIIPVRAQSVQFDEGVNPGVYAVVRCTWQWHPGPVCDACDTPWERLR